MYIFIVRGIVIQKSGWIKTSFSFIFRIYLFLAFIASYIYSVFERKMNNKMMERLWILRRWCCGAGGVRGRRRKWISITQTYCVWYKRNTILIQQSKAKISSYELKINVIMIMKLCWSVYWLCTTCEICPLCIQIWLTLDDQVMLSFTFIHRNRFTSSCNVHHFYSEF